MTKYSFSEALYALKGGERVARAGWNGRGMYLVLVRGASVVCLLPRVPFMHHDFVPPDITTTCAVDTFRYPPHIAMKTATGELVPWLASVTDIMADDWCIL